MTATMRTTTAMPAVEAETRQSRAVGYTLGVARLLLGFEFLWAFFDKAFGLSYGTASADAWIHGGSPASGVMFALAGPFTGFYQSITGGHAVTGFTAQGAPIGFVPVHAWVDWVYMASILLIGLGLFSGVMTRIAAVGGIVWMSIFYTATFFVTPRYNPFFDEHLLSIVVLAAIIFVNAGIYLGLGKVWQRLDVVKRHPVLY
jgi:thiosulfate dehydrogenase (quinone) large subunit